MKVNLAVTSPSFSKRSTLVRELQKVVPTAKFNEENLEGDKLISFLEGVEVVIVGREKLSTDVLKLLPQLRSIIKYGVGYDNIDIAFAEKQGLEVYLQQGTNKRSVAELALCFLIGLSHKIFFSSQALRQGLWLKDGGMQLTEKKVGIVGLGNTGSELVHLLKPFSCEILICDILDKRDFIENQKLNYTSELRLVNQETIFKESDFISLHVPLSPLTKEMINEASIKQMKKTAYLINTSRGEVIDEGALKKALMNGELAGAALDVYQMEPPTDLEFLTLPNLVGTPHIGGSSQEAALQMGRAAICGVEKYMANLKE